MKEKNSTVPFILLPLPPFLFVIYIESVEITTKIAYYDACNASPYK